MKYKVGDLVWDNIFDDLGIIIEIDKGGNYRICWFSGDIYSSVENENGINQDPIKGLLVTSRVPF
tara:strand:- start:220 stop:414 length:195 start_codon:yes stop_codon:yes gene_type:complete